ncbi:MAG TPA: asparaginase, partial [Burkholderiaceae bacterium]|nr:asparaginase [Burkholderiaceae bacterium]
LPGVVIVGTGGTIAGTAASPTQSTIYRPAALPIDALAETVPDLPKIARLTFVQPLQRASFDLAPPDWLLIRRHVREALARDDVAGVVVTHGTDTMEETAFFLHLTVGSDKPVVVTGAMRPATAYSADGPANLFNAVTVAAAPAARGRGTMVVMNERIHGALAVTKQHCASVAAFGSRSAGELGAIADGSARFFAPPPAGERLVIDVADDAALPRVDIVYGYAGIGAGPIAAAVADGARGLIYAGVGNGNAPAEVRQALELAQRQHVQVVRASRGLEGRITRNSAQFDDDALGYATAGELPPHKARVLLMLALTEQAGAAQLQAMFDRL